MAVTLFRKRKVINNIVIKNGNFQKEKIKENYIIEDDHKKYIPKEVTAKIRGKMYGRRTINR